MRRDSGGYRGVGSRKGAKVFWRSAFEAAICSIIEPNCAKPNGAVSLPNPSTVGCSELEQTAGLSWIWKQEALVITRSLYVEPSSPQSKVYMCYFASLHQQKPLVILAAISSTC